MKISIIIYFFIYKVYVNKYRPDFTESSVRALLTQICAEKNSHKRKQEIKQISINGKNMMNHHNSKNDEGKRKNNYTEESLSANYKKKKKMDNSESSSSESDENSDPIIKSNMKKTITLLNLNLNNSTINSFLNVSQKQTNMKNKQFQEDNN